MKALELKEIIIKRIAEINDISVLKAITTLLDSMPKNVLTLSEKQKDEIIAAKREVELGYISVIKN